MNTNLAINASEIRGCKDAFFAVLLILIFAIGIGMAFVPTAKAQAGVTGVSTGETTVGYISVAPTLIGVGQQLTVNTWVFPLPTTYDNLPNWNGFYGLTVTFTRPDGTKDTFMPTDGTGAYKAGEMQALGALYFYYAPSMAGNWSVSFTLPAQNITDAAGTVYYAGCTSNTFYFTVQTAAVLAGLLNGYPWAQLPNSNVYWSYPIDANNREWGAISGDWTGVTSTMSTVNSPTQLRWQPYGSGPSTPHIVWTNYLKEGGIIGGAYKTISYDVPMSTIVVMDGMAYVAVPNTTPVGQSFGQFRCINEATGQVMYQVNGTITNGIHLPGNTYDQASTAIAVGETATTLASSYGSYQYPYLWGTVTINGVVYWEYYDALTGVLVRQFNNCASARLIDGTVLAFGAQSYTSTTDTALDGYVYRWNMSTVVGFVTNVVGAYNWNLGITWKVPLPLTIWGTSPAIFAVSPDLSTVVVGTRNQYWGYNANTGALLWNLTVNYPITSNEEIPLAQVPDFLIFDSVASTYHCYSELTGALLWTTPSFASSPWATTWTVYYSETNDLNNLYIAFPDGSMRAYSLATGDLIWTSTPFASTEYANNAVPFVYAGVVMEGGLIYGYAGYSTSYQLDPLPRFNMLVCINATTGNVKWTLNGGVDTNAAANGYVIGQSIDDGYLYCIGKGQTSTSVTAQQQDGGSVLIQGSVLDQSEAQPNTPAICDANMSVWMDYLHMQNSTLLNNPPKCIGVPVTLTAVDSSGTTVSLGTVTSNYQGNYEFQWTPTTPGMYTIYANFAGTNSYFESSASTGATFAAAATPAPTAAPISGLATTSDLLSYVVVAIVVIIIAIAIVGALLLRKHP